MGILFKSKYSTSLKTPGGGLKGVELEPVVGDYLGGTGGGVLEAFSAGIGETFMFAPCVESA